MNKHKRQIMLSLMRYYPKTWRERYADEFAAILETYEPRWHDVFDILLGVWDAHYSQSGSKQLMKLNRKVFNIATVLMIIDLGIFALFTWLVVFFTVPAPTANNTELVSGTFISATSPCCDDLVISLKEYNAIFYFNQQGADLAEVNALFDRGDQVTLVASKRYLPTNGNHRMTTPIFSIESDTGDYYGPIFTSGSIVDYRPRQVILGIISIILIIGIFYLRYIVHVGKMPLVSVGVS